MNNLKMLLLSFLVVSASPNSTFAYTTPYYTLSPDVKISGPIAKAPGSTQANDVTTFFRTLIKSANALAKNTDAPKDVFWAFMITSLAVPLHESGLKHFQYLDHLGNSCQDAENSGSALPDSTRKVFEKYFKDSSSPIVPDCSALNPSSPATQLLGSQDQLSVGLMQLTLDYHEDVYVAPGYYKSVTDTAKVGMEQLYAGFTRVYHNFDDQNYACLKSKDDANQIDYVNLVRATWGGPYNSGNFRVASVCRFNNKNSGPDAGFFNTLKKIMTGTSSYELLSGRNKEAFDEIVDNFNNHANNHNAFDELVNSGDETEPPQPVAVVTPTPKPEFGPPTEKLTNGDHTHIRSGPSTDTAICSTVPFNTSVMVNDTVTGDDGLNWSEIQLKTPCAGQSTAYILSSLLTDPTPPTPAPSGFTAKVTRSLAIVRSSAPTGRIIEIVRKGLSLKIKNSITVNGIDWYQLSTNDGWIDSKYVTKE